MFSRLRRLRDPKNASLAFNRPASDKEDKTHLDLYNLRNGISNSAERAIRERKSGVRPRIEALLVRPSSNLNCGHYEAVQGV